MIALNERDADKIIFYLRRQKEMYMRASKDFLDFINILGEKKDGEDFINKQMSEEFAVIDECILLLTVGSEKKFEKMMFEEWFKQRFPGCVLPDGRYICYEVAKIAYEQGIEDRDNLVEKQFNRQQKYDCGALLRL